MHIPRQSFFVKRKLNNMLHYLNFACQSGAVELALDLTPEVLSSNSVGMIVLLFFSFPFFLIKGYKEKIHRNTAFAFPMKYRIKHIDLWVGT